MKKIIKVLLVVLVVFSIAACGKKEDAKQPETIAEFVIADFLANAKDDMTCEDIAWKLSENEKMDFMPVVMPVEEGYLNGFSAEISGFKSGAVFAPMIGSIPFIAYVFEVDGNADALVKALKDAHDLRWNICTSADEMLTEVKGNKVCFVMAPTNFEE